MNKLAMKILAVLNLGEGVIHIVTAVISLWGMSSLGVWDWRVATSPVADLGLGLVSLVTAVALGKWHKYREKALQHDLGFGGLTPAVPAR